MQKLPLPPLKYAFAGLLFLFLFGGEPTEFGKEKTFFHDYLIPKPVIQIGLGVNLSQIEIKASAGMKVYEVKADYRLIAENADEALVKGNKEKLTEKYLIQVAQHREHEEAERQAQRLRLRIDRKVSVDSTPEAGVAGIYKVQIGDFLTRDDALSYIVKLNRMGIQDTWIVRREVTEKESKPLWILIDEELQSLLNSTVLYFIPSSPQSFLSYKGRDYRGIFILRASRRGIVLVNTLNLEDYLKAVVPSELSPYSFPEIEAHKAQAVAARTYAIKNLGQYRELGFDLVDTPRSQFYRGMNAEHPLSTTAVEETRGVVAKYKGRYIDALYTSTCGGATEDVENVFLGPALPYLRGTECVYEKQRHWPLSTQTLLAPIYVHGRNVSPQIALLISLGVITGSGDTVSFREAADKDEVQAWLDSARALLGKTSVLTDPDETDVSIDNFLHSAVRAFGWEDRVAHLLTESEKDFVFSGENGWPENSRPLVAYFIQSGIFPSSESVGLHDRILTRGEAAFILAKMLNSYRDFRDVGVFQGIEGQDLILRENGDSHSFRMAPSAFLLINTGGHHSFVRDLDLLGGENLRWLSRDGEIQYLEVSYPAYSNQLDRSSKYHSWSVRLSREDLSRRINRYYPIGELVDLVPQERAKSERVSKLLIRGSETDATVRGFRIRTVLGLRETLFVLDRERDPGGRVSYFLFTGKGWGHGVGLCQVGAFGMAQTGADYQEILNKYYTGITLDDIY
jgi:stage II sporulation protein D